MLDQLFIFLERELYTFFALKEMKRFQFRSQILNYFLSVRYNDSQDFGSVFNEDITIVNLQTNTSALGILGLMRCQFP